MPLLIMSLLVLLPCFAQAAPTWQTISTEAGRRIEIDRVNMKREEGNKVVVLARLVLDKEINDPVSGGSYRIVESLTRYECLQRNAANLKRSYRKSEDELLRDEELKGINLPVLSGTLDDKVLREVCRPESTASAQEVVDKANEAADKLKEANKALLEKTTAKVVPTPVKKSAAKPAQALVAKRTQQEEIPEKPPVHWGYSGEGAPQHWHKINPRFNLCGSGQRQSPIDIRDGIKVDLEPIFFNYNPTPFSIIDNGHSIEAIVGSGNIRITGKTYELFNIHFHRPSEEMINGKRFDMSAHLVHKSDDGHLAVVAVMLEKGNENPLIQTLWNNLPLEKKALVSPSGASIDLAAFLPAGRSYFTYMGSLTTPPCTEGVLWLVLKQPVQVSPAQIDIFSRFYIHNARPLQPGFGRVIKEGR